jgi:predicted RNA binding protein YcfA (HicA-like mRNA interferase family)
MKLPVVSGGEAVKALRKAGYEFDEQHGSHIISSTRRSAV